MKLKYSNNWASDIYHVGTQRLLTLELVSIAGAEYKVTNREVRVRYSDMGHENYATSTHYFVKTKVFGRMMEFDLNTIKAPITVLKYTVEPKK